MQRQALYRMAFACAALPGVACAADHGPVFGLATPTNPQGGWSFNLGLNGRSGSASTLEAELAYGVTQNLKLALTAPIVVQPDPYPRSSITAGSAPGGEFSGLAWWRFHRKDLAGKRIESTAVAGLLVPGPQDQAGAGIGEPKGFGYLVGGVTGVASRSSYIWAGATYQRYRQSNGDGRPDLLTGTAVYGYRPFSWRTDYPRWDWRVFGELTAEKSGTRLRRSVAVPGTQATQLFLGPSVLGVYRAIGIEGGVQFPAYRDAGPLYPKERFRFAINFAYFF